MKKPLLSLIFALMICTTGYGQNSPLNIFEQPKPALPVDYGLLCVQGTLRLKVEFLASREIGKIIPVTRMPYGLTELAASAANRIEFEPEIRGGQPVSIFRTIDYIFGLDFGGWSIQKKPVGNPNGRSRADAQAEAVLQKAIQNLGGEKYLNVKTQIGRGKFSVMREGTVISFQSFIDVIVFPDKERTEFKGGGIKSVQTNVGDAGWTFDGDAELIKIQNEKQIADFKRGIRVSLDHLLRGSWRNEATLSYVGKRAATLGKRNDVVKLTYKDGLVVEFEFAADDGVPQKAIYSRFNADNEEIKEEDRYAQFVDVGGVKAPFIIDRFTKGVQSSRINYESLEFNKIVPDSIFAKPASPKELKKDLKL